MYSLKERGHFGFWADKKCYKKMVLLRHGYKTPSSPHLLTSFTSTKKKIFFKKLRNNEDFPHKFAEGNFTLLWVLFTDPSSDWSYLYIWKRERANGNVKRQYHKDSKTALENSFPSRFLKLMQIWNSCWLIMVIGDMTIIIG